MKERPILFSAPMVKALLEGRKTQTRRLVKRWALDWLAPDMFTPEFVAAPGNAACPHGVPGDRLWVKETFWTCRNAGHCVEYRATYVEIDGDAPKWKPSILMPRALSRITLEVTDVRVERLQELTEEDARAEGVVIRHDVVDDAIQIAIENPARRAFAVLWDMLNGELASWESNPWVWVLTFKRICQCQSELEAPGPHLASCPFADPAFDDGGLF